MSCKAECQRYLSLARRAIQVAELLLDGDYFAEAISRAYYAMFYAAQSLLKAQDVHVTKHSAVVARFGELFAKTRRMDPAVHQMLIDARDARQEADYAPQFEATPEQAAATIANAKQFVAASEAALGRV